MSLVPLGAATLAFASLLVVPTAHAQARKASASLVQAVVTYDLTAPESFSLAAADSVLWNFRTGAVAMPVHLNADRHTDYLVWMHPQVCGIPNCPFWIVRGTPSGPEVIGQASSLDGPPRRGASFRSLQGIRLVRNFNEGHAAILTKESRAGLVERWDYAFDGTRYVQFSTLQPPAWR